VSFVLKEPSEDSREPAELNRRRHENRWRRILRDADWDQNQTVRRWLKLAHEAFGGEKEKEEEDLDDSSKAA
jgi:hypothetical protein